MECWEEGYTWDGFFGGGGYESSFEGWEVLFEIEIVLEYVGFIYVMDLIIRCTWSLRYFGVVS